MAVLKHIGNKITIVYIDGHEEHCNMIPPVEVTDLLLKTLKLL